MSAVALALLAACASHASNDNGSSNSGEATTGTAAPAATDAATSDATAAGSTTINTGNGQVTVNGTIDASKLGVPVYPGAKPNNQGSLSVNSAKGSAAYAGFSTDDSFDKVYQFYKSQLPPDAEKMKTSSGNSSMAMFSTKVGSDTVSVEVVSNDKGGASVVISRGSDNK
jgi:hypothetical protein